MGHSKLSVTIPDEVFSRINAMAARENTKISHLVTEALIEKLNRSKEQEYIQQVNEVFKDFQVCEEQLGMADTIADNTDVDELPW